MLRLAPALPCLLLWTLALSARHAAAQPPDAAPDAVRLVAEGSALLRADRVDDAKAIAAYQRAVRLRPQMAEAHDRLGFVNGLSPRTSLARGQSSAQEDEDRGADTHRCLEHIHRFAVEVGDAVRGLAQRHGNDHRAKDERLHECADDLNADDADSCDWGTWGIV
jgi:hypothetical protein